MASDNDVDAGDGFTWNKGAIAAAVVMATIVLLAAYVLWPSNNNDRQTAERPTTTVGQSGGSTTTEVDVEQPPGPAGECPSDRRTSNEIPPPIDGTVTWDLYKGAAVPRSSTAGPLRVEDSGLAHCYERSPSGAVLAAMNFTSRVAVSPERLSIIEIQAVDNAARATVLDALAKFSGQVGASECPLAAYQVRAFSPTAATIAVATECGANDLRSSAVQLAWEAGDWKISYPSSIGTDSPPARLSSLDGWTEFRGIGS